MNYDDRRENLYPYWMHLSAPHLFPVLPYVNDGMRLLCVSVAAICQRAVLFLLSCQYSVLQNIAAEIVLLLLLLCAVESIDTPNCLYLGNKLPKLMLRCVIDMQMASLSCSAEYHDLVLTRVVSATSI